MDPLRTSSLEIVDDDGNVRSRIGVAPDGAVGAGRLSLWDADGRPIAGRVD